MYFNHLTYVEKVKDGSIDKKRQKRDFGLSMTVPDQNLSIRDILERYARGNEMPIGHSGHYDGEDVSFDDIDPTLDPAFDLADYSAEIGNLKQKAAEREAEREQIRADKERSDAEAQKAIDKAKKEAATASKKPVEESD